MGKKDRIKAMWDKRAEELTEYVPPMPPRPGPENVVFTESEWRAVGRLMIRMRRAVAG